MDQLTVQGAQVKDLQRALLIAPQLTTRFVRQELIRGGRRIVKAIKKEWLSGGKGINAPEMRKPKNKNVRSIVEGRTLRDMTLTIKGSKFIRIHALGAIIRPKKFNLLFMRQNKTRGGGGEIVGTAEQIVIKPRIHFTPTITRMVPALADKIGDAAARAVRKAIDDKVRKFGSRFAA